MEVQGHRRGHERAPGESAKSAVQGALAAPHAHPVGQVARALRTGPEGLRPDEAALRLDGEGPPPRPSPPRRASRWRGPPLGRPGLVLAGAAVIAALLGHPVDSAMIVVAWIGCAAVTRAQHDRAERVLRARRDGPPLRATVIRGDERFAVSASEVAAGDVVVLQAGDGVSADVRLAIVEGLVIDESWVPGGSREAGKRAEPARAAAPLTERPSMALAGSVVVAGCARGYATATGPRTALARSAVRLDAAVGGGAGGASEDRDCPILRQTRRAADRLAVVAAASVSLVVAMGLLAGHDAREALLAAVGVAVAIAGVAAALPITAAVTVAAGAVAAGAVAERVVSASFLVATAGIAAVLAIAGGSLVGLPPVLLPGQVLWLGLLAGACGVALACEPGAPEGADPASPGSHERLLTPWLSERAILTGGLMAAGSVGLMSWALSGGGSLESARAVGLTGLVLAVALHTAAARSERRPALAHRPPPSRRLLLTLAGAVVAQAWALQAPVARPLLRAEAIGAVWWLRAAALALMVAAAAELHKRWERSGSSDGAVSAAPVASKL